MWPTLIKRRKGGVTNPDYVMVVSMWPTLIERGKAQCQEVALAETFQCGRRSLSAARCFNAVDAHYAPEGR